MWAELRDAVEATEPDRWHTWADDDETYLYLLDTEWTAAVEANRRYECPRCGGLRDRIDAVRAAKQAVADLDSGRVAEGLREIRAWGRRHIYRTYGYADLELATGWDHDDAVRVIATLLEYEVVERKGRFELLPAPCPCECCIRELAVEPPKEPARWGVRSGVGPALRFRVLQRDGFRCQYCGRSARDGALLHVDHVIPAVRGGEDDERNLMTACDECNLGKSDTPVL